MVRVSIWISLVMSIFMRRWTVSWGFVKWTEERVYPLCHHYHDNDGVWLRTDNITTEEDQREVNRHFFLHGPGEALNFNHIWIPKGCSYHRFTNESFYRMIDDILESPRHQGMFPQNMVHLSLIGDSATRGLFCGINRILSGSEVNGPCEKVLCQERKTPTQSIQSYEMLFSLRFKITFVILEDCNKPGVFREKLMKRFLTGDDWNHPYAMVINRDLMWTGKVSRRNESQLDNFKSRKLVQIRSSYSVLLKMKYFSDLAKKHQVRLIYQNDYLASSRGVVGDDFSIDRLLEQKVKTSIPNSIWEFWDNRGLLQSMENTKNLDMPREVEIQVAQSLLNGLFYDYLSNKYDKLYLVNKDQNPLADDDDGEEEEEDVSPGEVKSIDPVVAGVDDGDDDDDFATDIQLALSMLAFPMKTN